MRRRALLICYYFPPLGLGGVGRPLSLFKRLPQHGWDCDILTVKPVLYRAYEPELLEGLDLSRIHRSGSRDPQRLLYLLGIRKVKAATISKGRPVAGKFFPDPKIGWVKPAVRRGQRLGQANRYDAIISTSPPISSHLIGLELSRQLDLPLVADFRDFWTIYKAEELFQDESRRKKALALLDEIKDRAAAVTTVNPSITAYLGTGVTITNGYDPDLAQSWLKPPGNDRFTIGLLGHQHDTREVEPLLTLLENIRDRSPELLEHVRLLQVGQVDRDWFAGLFRARGLNIDLDLRGRRQRGETIDLLSGAHVFYYGVSEREGPGFLPGRTFELIASGRPVFAYARAESEIARVLLPTTNACRFHEADYDRASAALLSHIRASLDGSYCFEPLTEYARHFSADELARRFATVLEGTL